MTAQSAGPTSPASAAPRVLLIGKPECHLCDVARLVIEDVCGQLGVAWQERSIYDDPALADEYWELIPVIMVDDEVLAHWTVDPGALRAALV